MFDTKRKDPELSDRLRWSSDRSGVTQELIKEYKNNKGALWAVDGEDIRREAMKHDKTGFFGLVSGRDIEKMLDEQEERKKRKR